MEWIAVVITLLGTGDNVVARPVPVLVYQSEQDCRDWVQRRIPDGKVLDAASGRIISGQYYACMPIDSGELGKTSAPTK